MTREKQQLISATEEGRAAWEPLKPCSHSSLQFHKICKSHHSVGAPRRKNIDVELQENSQRQSLGRKRDVPRLSAARGMSWGSPDQWQYLCWESSKLGQPWLQPAAFSASPPGSSSSYLPSRAGTREGRKTLKQKNCWSFTTEEIWGSG